MTLQNEQLTTASYTRHDEHILVVKRATLFPDARAWQGLKQSGVDDFLTVVELNKEFHPRSLMETDPRYKQVIPYLVFTHNNNFFLMQRDGSASEQRLKNKYSLGIGGHMRLEDFSGGNVIDWAQREFKEEIDYRGTYSVTSLGILNDDSTPVGEVHIGCILLLEGNSPAISVKSELASGRLATLEECMVHYHLMEKWSQIIVDYLRAR